MVRNSGVVTYDFILSNFHIDTAPPLELQRPEVRASEVRKTRGQMSEVRGRRSDFHEKGGWVVELVRRIYLLFLNSCVYDGERFQFACDEEPYHIYNRSQVQGSGFKGCVHRIPACQSSTAGRSSIL